MCKIAFKRGRILSYNFDQPYLVNLDLKLPG